MLIVAAVIVVGALVFLAILQNWRRGIYLFLVWLVFEDFIRKFSGNSTGMFFVKDIIAGMMFISMFAAWRRHRLPVFHPKFAKWLLLFVGLGIIQMFNPNTPSYFYGPLGFKLYFFYVPMMFAGYAYLRDEKDLQLFVKLNMWIALAVAGLGIAQSIVGPDFLNPSQLAPELQGLGKLVRESPLTHVSVARPTSVFVSDGRFAQFLILMYLLGFGAVGYLLLKKRAKPRLLLAAIGVTALATIMTGSRSAFIALMVNTLVLVAASSWGITASARRSLQVGRTVWRVTFAGGIAILLAALIFPSQTSARWAFYTETLSPASSASEFQYRAWQYPLDNVLSVFDQPNWIFGNGIGTASLGIQYVSAAIEEQRPSFGAESGYGQLILELGIIGPILWLLWTCVLFWESWKIVKSLRHTEFFPFSFALFWFLVYLLGIFTFYGLVAYQNYLMNVYAWLFVGMLFRLPGLVGNQRAISAPHANAQS
ncbi:MAG TPA: hypothetical protein VFO34_03020 [Candidatus Acidoferrales bacterium]|nr:hypothetical protein [Candidatus Acidoferrales bacterium]